jgi:hypothetical protein
LGRYDSTASDGARHDSTRVEGSTTTGRDIRRCGIAFGPAARSRSREANVRPHQTRGIGMGATRCVTPRQTCPRPNGFGRNLRSKTRWFTGFCNSHQVSHFATFFIDARAEISVAESRFDIQDTPGPPTRTANGAAGGPMLLFEFSLAHAAPGLVSPHDASIARAEGRRHGGLATLAPRPLDV